MAVTIYASQADLEEFLLGAGKSQVVQRGNFDKALDAASRNIDAFCNRRFWVDDSETTRVFTATDPYEFFVPDIATVTNLAVTTDEDADGVYETSWTLGSKQGAGFEVAPYNAQTDPDLKRPYTKIEANSTPFPLMRMAIAVTAKWGYPTVPDDIVHATLLQAARFWKRKDAVLGVGGSAETGFFEMRRAIDPDVRALISPYRNFAQ